MGNCRPEKTEAVPVLLVGAALFYSLLVHRSFTQQSELASEVVCWATLPRLCKARIWPDIVATELSGYSDIRPIPFKTLWLVAASLTISCIYKAENGMVELSPLLTPLLIIAQRLLQFEVPTSTTPYPSLLSPLTWGTTLCAFIAISPSSKWGYGGSLLSIIAVVPLLLVYVACLPKDIMASRQLPPLSENQAKVETGLGPRTAAMLTVAIGIRTVVLGFEQTQVIHIVLVGLAKACFWLFILRTRQHVSWCVAPAIQTFSLIATRDPFVQSSDTQDIFNVVASGLALAQVIHMLPERSKARIALWVFLLASLVPNIANMLAIRSAQSSIQRSFSNFQEHTAKMLVKNAEANFDTLMQRQSKTYTAACDEYRRRYSMEPPAGFEEWYSFATAHGSPLIDDFDTIYRSISPFWKLSGNAITQMMDHAQIDPEGELWSCVYSSTRAKTQCHHPHRSFDRHVSSLFNKLLKKPAVNLPDIRFLVNHLDEPRVLIPPQSPKGNNNLPTRLYNLTDMSRQPVWEPLTRHCAPHIRDTALLNSPAVETFGLPFVTNVSSAVDLCQNPQYEGLHGMFVRPTSFRLFEGPVPVLSTGSLSTMGDILYPSPAYFENEFQYDETKDVEWEAKMNNLYWAGATTGGYASDGHWLSFHRQRFVALAQNLEQKRHIYLQEIGGVVARVASKFLNGRLYDVAFTKVFQCTLKECRNQRMHFRVKPRANKFKAFRSRLAFDVDGNGISGRYHQLLASKSVPLKQTLIREWHDDRLMPWLHYIPISQSMDELPELVSYLTTSDTGQRIAKQVALLGQEWHAKAFREVDFSIYVYRLLLEIARLQDPKREARVD